MKVKRTFWERLFSRTPWVTHREPTEAERLRQFAATMQPSMPMGFDPLVKPTVTVRDYLAEKSVEPAKRVQKPAVGCAWDNHEYVEVGIRAPFRYLCKHCGKERPAFVKELVSKGREDYGQRVQRVVVPAPAVQTSRISDDVIRDHLELRRRDMEMSHVWQMGLALQQSASLAPEPSPPPFTSGGGGDFGGGGATGSWDSASDSSSSTSSTSNE